MFAHMLDFLNRSPPDPVRLPLTSSHWPVLTILGIYLVFIKIVGPWFMQNQKPYNLDRAIKIYNIVQIAYNVILLIFVSNALFFNKNILIFIICISKFKECALHAWSWQL